MKFLHENYSFEIHAEPTKDGFFGCYYCQCGDYYCSGHVDKTKERALQVAEGAAIAHYNRTHRNS